MKKTIYRSALFIVIFLLAGCGFAASGHAETVCRALLIAQTYEENDRVKTLRGSVNDVAAFGDYLTKIDQQDYRVIILQDLRASQILEEIADSFQNADMDDISFIYYTGHGASDGGEVPLGSLLGADGSWVTPDDLISVLQKIHGSKLLIVDACNSGGLLCEIDRWIETDCSVLTSSAYYESSKEDYTSGRIMGLFTYSVLEGIGGFADGQPPADYDDNGSVTLQELYLYTRRKMAEYGLHPQLFCLEETTVFFARDSFMPTSIWDAGDAVPACTQSDIPDL